MNAEQQFYCVEFVKLTFSLLPIGLILIAMVFLRRQQPTSQTLWLRSLAALWLIVAALSRLVLSRVVGLSLPGGQIYQDAEEARRSIDFYARVSEGLYLAEMAVFILFAVALVVFSRQRLQMKTPSI